MVCLETCRPCSLTRPCSGVLIRGVQQGQQRLQQRQLVPHDHCSCSNTRCGMQTCVLMHSNIMLMHTSTEKAPPIEHTLRIRDGVCLAWYLRVMLPCSVSERIHSTLHHSTSHLQCCSSAWHALCKRPRLRHPPLLDPRLQGFHVGVAQARNPRALEQPLHRMRSVCSDPAQFHRVV